MVRIFVVITIIVLGQTVASAKSVYVSTTGSDATTYANNDIDNPWLTVNEAFTNTSVAPGDTVFFRAGTYTITSTIDTKLSGSSGTPGSPIVFTSYPGEQAVFSSSTISGYTKVFKIQKNYQRVEGINFTGTPATWFDLGEDLGGDYFEVRNCDVELGSNGDNTGFVMGNPGADYCVVEYNTISGTGPNTTPGNTGGLLFLRSNYLTVRYNTISNCPIGIYFKHGQTTPTDTGNEIAYNYIRNCGRYSMELNGSYTYVHNNIFDADCGSFRINESNGVPRGDYNTIEHNIILGGNAYGALWLSDDDDGANNNTITNNIIEDYTSCCTGNTWDYNLYMTGSAIGGNDIANQSPTYTTTPQVNPEDYQLTAESYGYQAGDDSENMGVVDATQVGSGADAGETTPPGAEITPPTNLTATSGGS